MLTTTIPYALSQGATLLSRVRIDRLILDKQKVVRAEGHARNAFGQKRNALNADIMQHSAPRISLHAKHFIVAAGAIGSPALLLRSKIADPYQRIGKRTFLHPVVISTAFFDEPVNAWSGAPQSVYSDEFTFKNGVDGPCGYKLEVPPVHPVIASTLLLRHGHEHQQFMQQLPHMQAVLALLRDGFHEHSQGGQVTLDEHDDPLLDYPVTPYLFEAFQRALLSCAELQFAAGARSVMPLHKQAQPYASWQQARAAIKSLPMQLHQLQIFSAHVMGGCVMGEDEKQCVTDSNGRVRGMDNLSVHDGSLFPTSLGVNPQLTIYAIVRRLSEELTKSLAK